MPSSTCRPTLRLSLICAVCDRSSSVRASTGSRTSRLTPPIRSAAFSFCASQFAAALVAPFSDSANTDEPRARRLAERVGVDRHEQVGLHAPRLLHARAPAARNSRRRASASRACRARRRSCAFSLLRDREHDVLLVGAAAADRARILAAVPGIDRDGDAAPVAPAPRGAGFALGGAASLRARARRASRPAVASPRAAPSADRAASADRGRARRGGRTRRPASARRAAASPRRLRSSTTRSTSGGLAPEADAGDVRDPTAARATAAARARASSSTPSRSSTSRCGSFSASSWCASGAGASRMSARVLLRRPDPRRGDARGAAPTPPARRSCAAGSSSQPTAARRRSSDDATQRSGRRGAGDHRGQASLTRRRVRRERQRATARCRVAWAARARGPAAATGPRRAPAIRSGRPHRRGKYSARPAVSHSLGSANR